MWLDYWGIGNQAAATRPDLLELIDDRVGPHATIIAHPLPIEHWHAWLGGPTVVDASAWTVSRRERAARRALQQFQNDHQGTP